MKYIGILFLSLLVSCRCAPVKEGENPEPVPGPETEESAVWAMVTDGDQLLDPKQYNRVLSTASAGVYKESRLWQGSARISAMLKGSSRQRS